MGYSVGISTVAEYSAFAICGAINWKQVLVGNRHRVAHASGGAAMLTRRALFGLVAAAALDPDRLVWGAGRKLISIPRPPLMSIPVLRNTPAFTPGAFVWIHAPLGSYRVGFDCSCGLHVPYGDWHWHNEDSFQVGNRCSRPHDDNRMVMTPVVPSVMDYNHL
jgi:hypothetical protein